MCITRFIAGMGIGGEYAAINSAIDDLISARYRGRVDIAVMGTYWAGAILGTLGTYILLNVLDPSVGWRIGFLLDPVLGLVILLVRRNLPESPRWQIMNGRGLAAEESISRIEHEVERSGMTLPTVDENKKTMIAGTYLTSGILLGVSAFLFNAGSLTATTQTISWCVIFFFASTGASSAYLTVSEIFPLEVRAKAIAVFFAIAQSVGALGPVIYGTLIGDGSQPFQLFLGYLLGASVMIAGGLIAIVFAVAAENQSLEDIAAPLAATSRSRSGTTSIGEPPRRCLLDQLCGFSEPRRS